MFIKRAKVYFFNTYIFLYFMPLISLFFSLIVFHSIRNNFDKKLILKISSRTKIHWISWGFDLIGLIYDKQILFGIKTSKLMKFDSTKKNEFPELSRNSEWLDKVDLISTVLPNEYQLLESKFSFKKNKYFKWNYSSLNELIPKDFKFHDSPKNVMLGHSGSPYLNHLDFFPSLKSKINEFDSIIFPLSYGDKNYIEEIKKQASIEFSDKAICLSTFLPYKEYLDFVSSCKALIMPSIRQIGLGNIILFLYFGKSVYLDSRSTTYIFFKQMGFPVFDVSDFRNFSVNDNVKIDLMLLRTKLEVIWGDISKEKSMYRLFSYLKD